MKALRAALAAFLLITPAQAQFNGVTFTGGAANYPAPDFTSCDFNVPTTFNNIWYIDPVNGFAQNDYTNGTNGAPVVTAIGGTSGQGTATHPWSSLQAVFSTVTGYPRPLLTTVSGGSPTLSPIAPGDEILLNTGTNTQYGAITAGTQVNSTYLTIAAAPGQTPILFGMQLTGVQRVHFTGFAVQHVAGGGINTTGGKNVVLDNLAISTTDYATSATWTTQAAWIAGVGGSVGVNFGGASNCMGLINSHIFLVNNGITSGGSTAHHLWMQNNEIDHWTEDAIDYGVHDIVIDHNHLHDPVGTGNGAHMDFMQGLSLNGKTNYNIWINGNLEIFQEDPALPFIGAISALGVITGGSGGTDGTYAGVALTGGSGTSATANITISGGAVTVVTFVNPGIGYSVGNTLSASVGGVSGFHVPVTATNAFDAGIGQTNDQWTNLFVTNNLVSIGPFPHGIGVGGCNDCVVANNTDTNRFEVNAADITRGGIYASSNITVTNNIMGTSACTDPRVNETNNIIMKSTTTNNVICAGGVVSAAFGSTPGMQIGNNLLDTGGINSELTDIDTVALIYNFHLLSTAPARGFGLSTLPRPLVDQLGLPLNNPVDAGALAFP